MIYLLLQLASLNILESESLSIQNINVLPADAFRGRIWKSADAFGECVRGQSPKYPWNPPKSQDPDRSTGYALEIVIKTFTFVRCYRWGDSPDTKYQRVSSGRIPRTHSEICGRIWRMRPQNASANHHQNTIEIHMNSIWPWYTVSDQNHFLRNHFQNTIEIHMNSIWSWYTASGQNHFLNISINSRSTSLILRGAAS